MDRRDHLRFIIAATIIRTFPLIEAYTIPTPSMENPPGGRFSVRQQGELWRPVPMTPLSFPFAHNTLPLVGGKSYLEWIKIGYHRLPGFGSVHRGDCAGLQLACENEGRPVDRKKTTSSNAVGIAGDTIEIGISRCTLTGNHSPCRSRHNQLPVITDGTGFAEQAVPTTWRVRAASRSHRLNTVST